MSDSRDALVVGDSCYIYDSQGKRREAHVAKVARKWVTVHAVGYGNCMFDKTTNYTPKGPSHGMGERLRTLAQDKRVQERDRLRKATRELELYMRNSVLEGHTTEQIQDTAGIVENVLQMIKERQA